MRELLQANMAYIARIQTLEKTVHGLTASLQKYVGGTHNVNATTRGGLHERLLVTNYPSWQSVKFALEQVYCAATSTVAVRSHFQDEAGEVRVVGRFMWNPVGSELFGGLPPLQAYANHLLEAGSGRLLFRSEGKYGRGMQILDSGDCESTEAVGECDRTYLHRDWDNNRLNSLTIILALANDVMGYVTGSRSYTITEYRRLVHVRQARPAELLYSVTCSIIFSVHRCAPVHKTQVPVLLTVRSGFGYGQTQRVWGGGQNFSG